MTDLNIARGLDLPLDCVTQSIAILARKGQGKTYTAGVLAEEMLDAGQQVVIVDPTGVFWGLRSTAAGKPNDVAMYIFGGDHADVPLEESAGALIADTLVETRASAILDISHLSKTKGRKFFTDFAEQLYQRKGRSEYRTAMHLFIDEADMFAPQRGGAETARMIGATEDLVRRGRSRGIGTSLISQRPQTIHKDVLTQCEVLIAGQLVHPLDQKAVEEWVKAHDADDQMREFMASLAGLQPGDVWVWSPGWLNIFKRTHIRTKRTFDSSRTPKPGEVMAALEMAPIDLEALRGKMADAIERAKADDPAVLRAEIARLKHALANNVADGATAELDQRLLAEAIEQRDEALSDARSTDAAYVQEHALRWRLWQSVRLLLDEQAVPEELQMVSPLPVVAGMAMHADPNDSRHALPPRQTPVRQSAAVGHDDAKVGDVKLGAAERDILGVLAQYGERRPAQVALMTGRSLKGGGFSNAVSHLRSMGMVEGGGRTGFLHITSLGHDNAPRTELLPPPGAGLVEHWQGKLPLAERKILGVLAQAYPSTLSREETARRAEYAPTGGGFGNALSRLRTLGLIVGGSTLIVSEELVS